MKASSFKYLLKEGCKNVWHNRVMSFTSIGVLTTCLIIIGVAFLITANINQMVGHIEKQNEMVVFLDDVNAEKMKAIEETIKANENIGDIKFVSKEEALEITKEEFSDEDAYLLDDIKDRNGIPNSYQVKIKDLQKSEETQKQLESIDGVYLVKSSPEVTTVITSTKSIVTTFGMILILALAVISLVIITNTIRATIFTRRKEISIMKYVGATNNFIRIPFVVEGFLLGVISSLIAFFIIWGGYSYLIGTINDGATGWLGDVFSEVIPFEAIALYLGGFFFVTGAAVGTAGSAISIKNHVKV